ncbi:patatin family protein [Lachnospiraceae bacterium 62-35]
MIEGALVLEGGSLRCMFTAGVLDVLMEHEIRLSYVNGVSAGSMCGLNYVAGQKGRMLEINRQYLKDKRYISFYNLVKRRQVFNFDFVFGELSSHLLPFDYDAFAASEQKFEAVATRCKTGRPEYFEKGVCTDIMTAVQASGSMPVLSRMITLDGKKYLDGGISMPIAYKRALELGYDKVVVILTRNQGYRKPPLSSLDKRVYNRYFSPLPDLRRALYEVPDRYNRMQEEMEELERQGKLFLIRPENPVKVSRLERDFKKLEELYQEGRLEGKKRLEELKIYLG